MYSYFLFITFSVGFHATIVSLYPGFVVILVLVDILDNIYMHILRIRKTEHAKSCCIFIQKIQLIECDLKVFHINRVSHIRWQICSHLSKVFKMLYIIVLFSMRIKLNVHFRILLHT